MLLRHVAFLTCFSSPFFQLAVNCNKFMSLMNMKIENDGNEVKYISLLRKHTDYSISEIKSRLRQKYTLSYDLLDLDELKKMRDLKDLLIKAGAKIQIYENEYKVQPEFLDNLIESDIETRQYFDEIDDLMFGTDGLNFEEVQDGDE